MIKKIITGAFLLGAFGGGYYIAHTKWELKFEKFQLKQEQEYNQLLEEKIEADKLNRERVQKIETDYLEQINEQKVKHEKDIIKLRSNFKPSGVHKCSTSSGNSMSRQSDNSTESICYRRKELLSRIEGTLAIGMSCDELQAKYKALLEVSK